MKVVQLLYSYLLTRSDFKLMSQPERQTRDNRFGYETYINLVLLMLELSGYKVSSKASAIKDLKDNKLSLKIAKALSQDSDIREIIARGNSHIDDYAETVRPLYNAIINSTIFSDFSKKRNKDIEAEVTMWTVVLDTIIARNPEVESAARLSDNFTQAGFALGIKMFRDTLNNYSDNRRSLEQASQALEDSLDKAYELYHLLLLLPVQITSEQRDRIEAAKDKYVPTSADLNPDTRFIDNALVDMLAHNPQMEEYLKGNPINLDEHYMLVKKMLDDVLQSQLYADYMKAESTDRARDCEFWRLAMKNIILPSDALAELLENASIYWNDDLEIMGTFALKTIKQAAVSDDYVKLLPQYKDDDDARFGAELFTDTIKNRELYRSYIDRFIDQSQWDADRLAFMDIVIMMVAVSELINFPSIPIPVTLNEYIEIANSYSTPRSGQFVNGMLFSIINMLKADGKLSK
ncbi:MAG: transcription antitermination protein NusB [Clostridiales bacterium]|nr:transcription antitermination protein NusB [Clostridiales bacterium]